MSSMEKFSSPEGLRTLANYLRSNLKTKSAIQHDKRVDYFKGKNFISFLLEGKNWPKSLPKISSNEEAIKIGTLLLSNEFFHQSEKLAKKGYLQYVNNNNSAKEFNEKLYYTWMYSGSMMWSNLGTVLIIFFVVAFTLLPIWPMIAKKGLWYISVTFLIFLTCLLAVRLLLFILFWLVGYECWIFPRLFDESISVQDSFKPLLTFEKNKSKQNILRLLSLVLLFSGFYYLYTQETDFDHMIQVQKEFIDDLYSGKLIADVAFDPKDHLNKMNKKVPSLEDLLKDLDGLTDADGAKEQEIKNMMDDRVNKEINEQKKEQEKFEQDEIDEDIDEEDFVLFDENGDPILD